ncbi:MAG: glycosyltransferase [Polyangiaceae bacterium]
MLWGTAIYASVELMAVGLLRRRGIPSMAHFVSTAADRRAGGMAQHLLKGALLKAYAGYLPVGIRQLDYLLSLGVASEQCFVVGNPVDNLAFGGVESGSLPEGLEHGRYFLYVGRFAPEKNLSLLLRAYRRHASAMEHPWPLVLVGSGPSEASLRDEAAASEGAGHVVFLPFTEGQALSRLYGAAGCFVLPSLSEPWGLVVNEATAAGLPVILSDRCGCLPHLLREPENGWSFDPRDEDALVRYLARASSADLDREAVASVSRRLASGQTVERYAELVARGCHTTLERWARKGSA